MKTKANQPTKWRLSTVLMLSVIMIFSFSCETEKFETGSDLNTADLKKVDLNESYQFDGTVFDISATPDGSIMLGLNKVIVPATEEQEAIVERSIKLIKNGEVRNIQELDVDTDIQGIEAIGAGNVFFTTAGTNLAMDGELYRASKGNVRMVADLAKYERENDPDAFAGPQWKDQQCENYGIFSAGPQNNPFKLTAIDGETVLVADAAGNTILQATTDGDIDWKAIFTPPVENGEYMVLFETDGLDCYVQPVPTSVAIGPDGYIYVGELIGEISGGLPTGLSRVWKLPVDDMNVVCSEIEGSGNCNLFIDELTAVIDLEIGPDGLLYVVEYDENSWLAPFIFPEFSGTVSAYNLDGKLIKEATGLQLPSAITFDKKGNLWLLEKNIFSPTVRILNPDEFEDISDL